MKRITKSTILLTLSTMALACSGKTDAAGPAGSPDEQTVAKAASPGAEAIAAQIHHQTEIGKLIEANAGDPEKAADAVEGYFKANEEAITTAAATREGLDPASLKEAFQANDGKIKALNTFMDAVRNKGKPTYHHPRVTKVRQTTGLF